MTINDLIYRVEWRRLVITLSLKTNVVFVLISVGTKDGTIGPGFGRPDGDGDDRLAHILNEMKHPMGQQSNDDSRSNDDSCSPRTQCPSPYSKVSICFTETFTYF